MSLSYKAQDTVSQSPYPEVKNKYRAKGSEKKALDSDPERETYRRGNILHWFIILYDVVM